MEHSSKTFSVSTEFFKEDWKGQITLAWCMTQLSRRGTCHSLGVFLVDSHLAAALASLRFAVAGGRRAATAHSAGGTIDL
jgi:hypothetical protein